MTLSHTINSYHVKLSLNVWFNARIAALTFPATFAAKPGVVFDMPDKTAVIPVFSVDHFEVDTIDRYQGRNADVGIAARRAVGMMDISCWVSRKVSPNWAIQLAYMQAVVQDIVTKHKSVTVSDYTTPAAPVSTPYRVFLTNSETTTPAPDANPAIERRRTLVTYIYDQRSSTS